MNVCVFSATLFLQLALKLLKQHGLTTSSVQTLRELVVEEGEYTRRRKQAAKDINQLRREYGRMQQVARIRQRDEANASAAGTSSAPM